MIRPHSRQQALAVLVATPVPALALSFIAWQVGTLQGWSICLGLLCLISILGWLANERRRRAIANTPTARIGSAPQGYVELAGHARLAGDPLFSPASALPCVWYRCLTERAHQDNRGSYEYVSMEESEHFILLADGSGEVLIDPEHALIEVAEQSVLTRGDYRYTEWLIRPGQPLFALGEFASVRSDENLDFRQDVSLRLAQMKQDKPELLRRFDRNRDGEIDLAEWENVRAAAEAEIAAEYRAERSAKATHVLRRPTDNRLFLVTTRNLERQLLRYRLWRWFHLIVLVCALQTLWLLQHDPSWLDL